MSFRAADIMAYRVPEIEQELTAKDCMLYALGLGLGGDPLSEQELRFVYEKDLRVLPTMASILAHPGFWMRNPDTGVDWQRVVHGQQAISIHKSLPSSARLKGASRVIGVEDKGPEKGAVVHTLREISDLESGDLLATAIQTVLCRGNGGAGSAGDCIPAVSPPPDEAPLAIHEMQTLPRQALIYRLSGDLNPLHADPAVASAAGFSRPILHGLATFGIAGYAILATVANHTVDRLTGMTARFAAPVFPGDCLRTDIWNDGVNGYYKVRVPRRDNITVAYGAFSLSNAG